MKRSKDRSKGNLKRETKPSNKNTISADPKIHEYAKHCFEPSLHYTNRNSTRNKIKLNRVINVLHCILHFTLKSGSEIYFVPDRLSESIKQEL